MTDETIRDVLIIGGGLVGGSLACALGGSTLSVTVLESFPLDSSAQPSYDDRTVALAYGSRRIFEGMGVWRTIVDGGAYPIREIHISDRGRFGAARLSAEDAGLEALGYVAANRAIGGAVLGAIDQAPGVELLSPAEVRAVEVNGDCAICRFLTDGVERSVRARLVVLADGGRSGLAETLGFRPRHRQYTQSAVVSNVTPERPHQSVAYERFTDTGPLALLPMDPQRCAVVWSVRPQEVEPMLAWTDEEFLRRLGERFGKRLGRFTRAGRRYAYPLSLTRLREQVRPRLVVIGNAAHTVHPVAGQGFNLGLRDVASLAERLVDAHRQGLDIGAVVVLDAYANRRRGDNLAVSMFTDGLIRVFSNDFPPLATARDLGLLGVDVLPWLKRAFTRRTSGVSGRLPRLARGLPLS